MMKGTQNISGEEYFESREEMIDKQMQDVIVQPKKPKVKSASPQKGKPIVVIEQTADGPVKHVFYGDVQVVQEEDE